MDGRPELPEGIDQLRVAVRAVDTAERAVAEAEALLAAARKEHRSAHERVRELIALGSCAGNACPHVHPEPPLPRATQMAALAADPLIPKVWRLALIGRVIMTMHVEGSQLVTTPADLGWKGGDTETKIVFTKAKK